MNSICLWYNSYRLILLENLQLSNKDEEEEEETDSKYSLLVFLC